MRPFRSPDGTMWHVEIPSITGSSNAVVIFHHPDDASSRKNRYAWFISRGPEARSVTSRLSPDKVMQIIDDAELARLYRRSMPVSRPDPLRTPVGATAPSNG